MSEKRRLNINGSSIEVEILERKRGQVRFLLNGRSYEAQFEEQIVANRSATAPSKTRGDTISQASAEAANQSAKFRGSGLPGEVTSPIPGLVTAVLVAIGEKVAPGQPLLRVEAMKMENTIFAQASGRVRKIHATPGQEVSDGQILLEID